LRGGSRRERSTIAGKAARIGAPIVAMIFGFLELAF